MDYLTLEVDCGTIRVNVSYGWISFESHPPGADIYIIASGGGSPIYIGHQTPNTIQLPIGNYDYILKLTGFNDYTGTAMISANDTTYIIANLTLIPIITPALVIAGISMLGFILVATAGSGIPITTGILGGKVVRIKL